VEVDIDNRGGHLDSVTIGKGEESYQSSNVGDATPAQNWASRAGEAMGDGLNTLDNFVQTISRGLDRLPPEKREALDNATGKAAQMVGNIAGAASKLAGGALAGAKIGFKLNEELVGGDISLGLTQSTKEKEEEENLRRSLNNPNDTQT
jgi:hypothetical protein